MFFFVIISESLYRRFPILLFSRQSRERRYWGVRLYYNINCSCESHDYCTFTSLQLEFNADFLKEPSAFKLSCKEVKDSVYQVSYPFIIGESGVLRNDFLLKIPVIQEKACGTIGYAIQLPWG